MNIGKLDCRVTIQQKSSSLNALGEEVAVWTDLATVWAQVNPLRGKEFFAARETQSSAEVRFYMRFRSDITELMRLVWGGVNHDIVAKPMNVNGQSVLLEIMATAGVRDGR